MLIIGHRGACGYEPENTLISFEKAISLGVDMVEFDVQKCKSGELVVIHDDTVNRTTDDKGKVEKLTLEQLKSFDCEKGQKIPSLEEVLDLINRRVKVNIEIKSKGITREVCEVINSYLSKGWAYNDFLVSSFNHKDIYEMQKIDLTIPRGIITSGFSLKYLRSLEDLKPYTIMHYYRSLTKRFLKAAHEEGVNVFVWTGNNKKVYEKLKKMGIDGVFSDYPDKFVEDC